VRVWEHEDPRVAAQQVAKLVRVATTGPSVTQPPRDATPTAATGEHTPQ
jgi:hypothetical protein